MTISVPAILLSLRSDIFLSTRSRWTGRSFVIFPQDSEDKAIIEAIIAMGKTLSLNVVAEGVETPEQDKFLREKVCDEMQGFYFSKPVAS